MSRTIPHRELRNNSSNVLKLVASGETFEITNHGDVVAVLSPAQQEFPAGLHVRQAGTRGGFISVKSIRLDHPIQETLDALRDDS